MNFEDAKTYIDNLYKAGTPVEENSDEYFMIQKISKQARLPEKKCNCSFADRMRDTIIQLKLYFKKNESFPSSKYAVTRGICFIVDGVPYTHQNITDEIAEKLLEERGSAKKYITVISKDDPEDESEDKSEVESELTTKRRKR